MKSSWALEMFCIPYSFFFLVGFTGVLVGQKVESQTITKKYAWARTFWNKNKPFYVIVPRIEFDFSKFTLWSDFEQGRQDPHHNMNVFRIGKYTQLLTRLLLS